MSIYHTQIQGNYGDEHAHTAGVTNVGTLTITNSTISKHGYLSEGGGGLDNRGTCTIWGSLISDNVNGVPNDQSGSGGGITNWGTLTLNYSTVSNNTALSAWWVYV